METFNIMAALTIAVNVIKHLQSAIKIIVNPLPVNLCENLISDKHWFSENVLCLLSNAVKYSDGGTVTVSIELLDECGKLGKDIDNPPVCTLRVSIEDTGIGLSEDARENLFLPFKQAQRLAGGTGLGLFSLSKRTEALGGSRGVSVRKDGKRGSNFWFSFPYRPDFLPTPLAETVQTRSQSVSPNASSSDMSVASNLRVLLIDDSLTIIQVIGRVLRNKGFKVTTANNGSAGLDCLIQGYASKEFDFVLMDLQMPVMVSNYQYFIFHKYSYSYFPGVNDS